MASSISSHCITKIYSYSSKQSDTCIIWPRFSQPEPPRCHSRDRYRGIIEAEREAPTDILVPLPHVYVNPRNLPCNPALINTRSATDHSRDLRQTKVLQKGEMIDENWRCTIASVFGSSIIILIHPIKNNILIVNNIHQTSLYVDIIKVIHISTFCD